LVTIPIKLYSAVEDHDVALHQVHAADGGRIRYRRVCEVCGQTVEMRDIAKAYEAPDGSMVVLDDEDFASLPADRSKEIAVEQFAPAEQIDSLLFDRSYYLEPAAPAAKAYVLLRTTLQQTERVAIVRFALRQRTQLGALRVHDDVLAVQTLRWPDEVRSFELPEKVAQASVTPRELEMAATLVDSYAEDFQPDKFTDEYRDEMQALIDAKIAGGQAFPEAPAAEQGQDAEVLDLLAALERSVERRGGGAARGGAARSGSKAGAARGGARASASRGGASSGASRGRAVPEAEPKEPSKARKPRLTAVAQSDDKPRSTTRRGRAASDADQEQAAAAERRHQRKGA
jgi:DNA end-binding protein Ku